MAKGPLGWRVVVTAGLLLASTVILHGLSHGERVPSHRPLAQFPLEVGGWQGQDEPFPERIVKAVGVSDYLNRLYADDRGATVELYVGYYESQRTGDTIHSPKNCLPGAGWEPVAASRKALDVGAPQRIPVNEYVVQKGLDRLLVIYWYESQGRVVASEYWGKFWMVADAISRNRTDGALVRLTTPVGANEAVARRRLERFAATIYPLLNRFLPG
jgi:EpsI family protein